VSNNRQKQPDDLAQSSDDVCREREEGEGGGRGGEREERSVGREGRSEEEKKEGARETSAVVDTRMRAWAGRDAKNVTQR